MKLAILGIFAFIAATHAGHLRLLHAPTATLVRTPSLDSAIVHSERLDGGAFSYSTFENHAYAPVQQVYYPSHVYQPQYPVYYPTAPAAHPFYPVHPSYPAHPSYPWVIQLPAGGAPGVNPQNPVEVESPADNAPADLTQIDEDTVAVESA